LLTGVWSLNRCCYAPGTLKFSNPRLGFGLLNQQRRAFETADAGTIDAISSDDELPPAQDASNRHNLEAKAYFVPDETWQRPSDYIAFLASEFEAGNTTLPGKKKKTKKLTRGQVLFLMGFADACNKVWQQEQDDIPMQDRQQFMFLLMGQGGSGKTAIVQEIVLPAVDFIWISFFHRSSHKHRLPSSCAPRGHRRKIFPLLRTRR